MICSGLFAYNFMAEEDKSLLIISQSGMLGQRCFNAGPLSKNHCDNVGLKFPVNLC